MQTGYFILLLIGFAWLALWSVQATPPSKKGWWPFDMRADLDSLAEAVPGGRRGMAAASRTVAPPTGPMPPAPHGAGPATGQAAWRQRRDLPDRRRPGR